MRSVHSAATPADNPEDFQIENGVLIKYRGQASEVQVPAGVIAIGDSAFLKNNSLRAVVLPVGVLTIDRGAFSCCQNLSSVWIPKTVTAIGVGAFYQCLSLTSVILPNSLQEIANSAFAESGLLSVRVLGSVIAIADDSFNKCQNLQSVTIDEGVKTVGLTAFMNCYSLFSMQLPNSIDTIGESAFLNCKKLAVIYTGSLEVLNLLQARADLPEAVRFRDTAKFPFLSQMQPLPALLNGMQVRYQNQVHWLNSGCLSDACSLANTKVMIETVMLSWFVSCSRERGVFRVLPEELVLMILSFVLNVVTLKSESAQAGKVFKVEGISVSAYVSGIFSSLSKPVTIDPLTVADNNSGFVSRWY